MPYVKRNADNKVAGVFARKQPGYAEEFLSSDDEEVIEYLTPPVVSSFEDDVIDALTGTTAEQTAAKARLKARKP